MELAVEDIRYIQSVYSDVNNILNNKKYIELSNYPRHQFTNTYDHSIRVAALAAKIAKKIGANEIEAIRVGLLHDMCFVNYYERNEHEGCYCFYHPIEAVENADAEFGLNNNEKAAIRSHMFPMAVRIPLSRVGWSLTLADKYIATLEILYGLVLLKQILYIKTLGLARVLRFVH